MTNVTGQITLNGVTDPEMARIWETKAKHGSKFIFVPGFQPVTQQPQRQSYPQQPNQHHPGVPTYNGVTFTWNDTEGLAIIQEVIAYLLRKEEKEVAVAQ